MGDPINLFSGGVLIAVCLRTIPSLPRPVGFVITGHIRNEEALWEGSEVDVALSANADSC